LIKWLPGILRKQQVKRVQGVRSGILWALKRESLTGKQVAQRLGMKEKQVLAEIGYLVTEGSVHIVTTQTVKYDLPGRGRKTHTARVYRAR
jgi:predicted ArsR family transcriptional regulator